MSTDNYDKSLIEPFIEVMDIWNLNDLLSDLENAKGGELTDLQYQCLLGSLLGYSADKISIEIKNTGLNISSNTIRNCLSNTINKYIVKILDFPDCLTEKMNWTRAINLLIKQGYINNNKNPKFSSKIIIEVENIEWNELSLLIERIRKVAKDKSLKIVDIKKGSIHLLVEGSREGIERLAELFEKGQLSDILDFPIQDFQISLKSSKNQINLSRWFDEIFETGWQSVDSLFNPLNTRQFAFRNFEEEATTVQRAKLIDRTMITNGFAVILVIQQKQQINDVIDITVSLYPTENQSYLPEGMQLKMSFDGGDEVIQAKASDRWLTISFSGSPEEEFNLEISLGDIKVNENFIV